MNFRQNENESVTAEPLDDNDEDDVLEPSVSVDSTGKAQRTGIKEFEAAEQEWVETALALGTPYDMLVDVFLGKFPEYCTTECPPDELKRIIRQRIKHANTSKARVSYKRIREKKKVVEDVFDTFLVMNPIPQIVKLQELFDRDDLKPTEYLKVIDAAQRLRDKLLGTDAKQSSGTPKSVWEKDDSEVLGSVRLGGKKKNEAA